MGTVPGVLHEACAQRETVHELWIYLNDPLTALSLTSMPLLAKQLFNTYLRDFEGVPAFLTAIAKIKQDLEQGGFPIPDVIISGAILNGLGDQYMTAQELIQTLPSTQ